MSHSDPNQQQQGSYGPPGMPYMHQGQNAQMQYAHPHARYGTMPDGSLHPGAATVPPQPPYMAEAQGIATAQTLAAQHNVAAQGGYPNYEDATEQGAASLHLAQHQARMNEMLAAGRAQQTDDEGKPASKPPAQRKRPARKSVSPQEAWDSKFKELEQFYEDFGHSDVPQTYKPNKALGKWVGKQREHYKNLKAGKPSPLTDERQNRLVSVDFKFQMGKGQHAKIHGIFITEELMETWEARYKDLIEYKSKYGHCDVPVKYEANKALGRWVALQRRKFRELETNKISSSSVLDTRIQKLTDLGFKFIIGRGDYIRSSGLGDGISNQEELWEDRFKRLEEYREQFGNADVPQAYTDKKLSQWVTKQREQHKLRMQGKSSSMTDDRLARLEGLGFHFRAYAALWDERIEELKKYVSENGHTNVKSSENNQLYIWVSRQRQTFRDYLEGQKSPMDHDRIRKLEELGFDWKYDGTKKRGDRKTPSKKPEASAKKPPAEKTSIDSSSLMPDFAALFPAAPMPELEDVTAPHSDPNRENEEATEQVGDEVRKGALEQKSDADDELIGAVEEADIEVIDTDEKEPIPVGEHDTTEAIALEDQAHEPAVVLAVVTDEAPTTHAAASQAASAIETSDGMAQEGDQKLPQIDFEIGAVDLDGKPLKRGTKPELWLRHYEQLLAFKIEHGHCRVPCKFNENKKLGSWVKLQREDYKKMKEKKSTPMCKYRINLLEKIGFEWRIASEQKTSWEERLDALKIFKEGNGHCDVPQAYPKDVALGKWVSKQRDFYRFMQQDKPTRMTQDRVDKLNELGFRWVIGKGKALRTWENYFQDLVKFKDKHGHTNIPTGHRDSPALGTWAAQQRKNFIKLHDPKLGPRKGMAEKLKRLEDLGFHFHMKGPGDKKLALPPEPKKRGRPRKSTGEDTAKSVNEDQPKKRGRPKKSLGNDAIQTDDTSNEDVPKKSGRTGKSASSVDQPKKRGRPKKDEGKEDATKNIGRSRRSSRTNDDAVTQDSPKKRGRPRKSEGDNSDAGGSPQKKRRGRPPKQITASV